MLSRPRTGVKAAAQGGFTLIELLIGLLLTFLVVSIPLNLTISSLRDSNRVEATATTTSLAQVALDRLGRDLRQAVTASFTATTATLTLPKRQTTARWGGDVTDDVTVVWTCTPTPVASSATTATGTCTRKVGTGTALVVQNRVTEFAFCAERPTANGACTTPATNPPYVSMRLAVQISSNLSGRGGEPVRELQQPVRVRDGVSLRNYG